jgi:hypothetical protein
MATITLDRTWLNLLVSGDAVSAFTDPDRSTAFSRPVDVKHYAGGRQRSVAIVGESGTVSFRLIEVTWATVEKLRTWSGQVVQVRDNRGRLFVGTWADVTPADMPYRIDAYAVALTLRLVTADEGV